MPYIDQDDRHKYDGLVDKLASLVINNPDETKAIAGQLNYIITTLLLKTYQFPDCLNYADINSAIGVLECAKLELYRRQASPYEDKKIKENGDV